MDLSNTKYFLIHLLIITFVFFSCDKNPTSPEQNKLSSISILVIDELGNPLKGVQVITFPGTVQQITNQDGQTIIQDIPAGKYQVVVSRADIPIFYRDVILRENKTQNLTFIVANEVTINIVVRDIFGNLMQDIEVSTSPHTSKVITNENGVAVLENVPVRRYTFIVERSNASVYIPNKSLIVRNGELMDIEIEIDSQPPFIKIIEPPNHQYQNIFDIHFVADGYDFEDGVLPFEAFTWYSDIDGELGTGREITVDRLSIGHHKITLAGIDSEQNITERFIKLNLYYYEEQSYFPLPWGGYWNYQYQTPEFSIIGVDGNTEDWTLSDLKVSMEDINTRNCLLEYTIVSKNITKHCQYYVVDHFETDTQNIYVAKTTENLKIWYGKNTDDKPSNQMNIETVYNPRYLLIGNHMDISTESSYETTVTADISWYFEEVHYGSKSYWETIDINTFIDIGGIETIETDFGTYDTVILTISQGETIRTWWMAKGLGIVQLDYNTIESPQLAVLYDTNISDFQGGNLLQKHSAHLFKSSKPAFSKAFETSLNTPEGNLELCRFLRNLCPR
ncbi:MAG TPA: carboxypeptidase regulatory-like domain-containing protein [bacterium]|nr:carboxypeptidase regulatory-like domain-containing protein [bacterium]